MPISVRSGLYNPATGLFEAQRTAIVFKTVTLSNTGNIWVPAQGKRFRILSGILFVPEDCTLVPAAELTVTLYDGAVAIPFTYRGYFPNAVPAVAVGGFSHTLPLKDNGYPSIAVNNILSAHFSAALASGNIEININGTEE